MHSNRIILFFVYLLFGLYFINSALFFYEIPEKILIVDKWIKLVGGVLIILGGLNYIKASRKIRRYKE
jgi:hypothetical protein